MEVDSGRPGAVGKAGKGGGIEGNEAGREEGPGKGGGTTGMWHGEVRKEGRREGVRSGGIDAEGEPVEGAVTDASIGGEEEENQAGKEEEKGM